MSAYLEQTSDRFLLLRINGELRKSELDAVQTEFAGKFARVGAVKLLVLLENFAGWKRGDEWSDTDFFVKHGDDIEKIAVVGHPRWEAQVLAFTGAGLRKAPVKFFPETGEGEARTWLVE